MSGGSSESGWHGRERVGRARGKPEENNVDNRRARASWEEMDRQAELRRSRDSDNSRDGQHVIEMDNLLLPESAWSTSDGRGLDGRVTLGVGPRMASLSNLAQYDIEQGGSPGGLFGAGSSSPEGKLSAADTTTMHSPRIVGLSPFDSSSREPAVSPPYDIQVVKEMIVQGDGSSSSSSEDELRIDIGRAEREGGEAAYLSLTPADAPKTPSGRGPKTPRNSIFNIDWAAACSQVTRRASHNIDWAAACSQVTRRASRDCAD